MQDTGKVTKEEPFSGMVTNQYALTKPNVMLHTILNKVLDVDRKVDALQFKVDQIFKTILKDNTETHFHNRSSSSGSSAHVSVTSRDSNSIKGDAILSIWPELKRQDMNVFFCTSPVHDNHLYNKKEREEGQIDNDQKRGQAEEEDNKMLPGQEEGEDDVGLIENEYEVGQEEDIKSKPASSADFEEKLSSLESISSNENNCGNEDIGESIKPGGIVEPLKVHCDNIFGLQYKPVIRRAESPLLVPNTSILLDSSHLKRKQTELSDDNRVKYFEKAIEVITDKGALPIKGQEDRERTGPEKYETNSQLTDRFVPNNQLIPASGFKNDHGPYYDNRFKEDAHSDSPSFLDVTQPQLTNTEILQSCSKQEEVMHNGMDMHTHMHTDPAVNDMEHSLKGRTSSSVDRNSRHSMDSSGSSDVNLKDNVDLENKQGERPSAHVEMSSSHIAETEVETLVGDAFIQALLQTERQKAEKNTEPKSQALDTVICVDTSQSMMGKPLARAQQLIMAFLDGLKTAAAEFGLEENVSIVTFGKTNKVQQHLTNNYDAVRTVIENLEAGGPSPMWLGLALSLTELGTKGGLCKMSDVVILPRIIVLSDGFATQKNRLSGRDVTDTTDSQSVQQIQLLLARNQTCVSKIECVTFGDHNKVLLSTISRDVYTEEDLPYLIEFFRTKEITNNCLVKCREQNITETQHLRRLVETYGLQNERSANDVMSELKTRLPISGGEPELMDESHPDKNVSVSVTPQTHAEAPQNLSTNKDTPQTHVGAPQNLSTNKDTPQTHAGATQNLSTNKDTPQTHAGAPQNLSTNKDTPQTHAGAPQNLSTNKDTPQLHKEAPQKPTNTLDTPQETLVHSEDNNLLLEDLKVSDSLSLVSSQINFDPNGSLPVFGTRLKANSGWEGYQKYAELFGTVVGQRKDCLKVLWSDGTINKCRYGLAGQYDVRVDDCSDIDETFMQIGAKVQRGNDWKWGDQDGGAGSVGVVIKMDKKKKVVYAMWPNNQQGNYRYGYKNSFDVQLIPEGSDLATRKCVIWQIELSESNWSNFPKEVSESIEDMHMSKPKNTFLIRAYERQYRISLVKNEARDLEAQVVYAIRRELITDEKADEKADSLRREQ